MSSSAAVKANLTPIAFAQGQQITSKLIRIDDISSLNKSLGIEVTASGSYMGFSANAKVDFASECNFNSHSIYLLANVEVKNAFQSMDDPVFTDDAIELLKNKLPERFRERFGDVFVAGVSRGGEYFAVYQISGSDQKEKEELSVSVQGFVSRASDFGRVGCKNQEQDRTIQVSPGSQDLYVPTRWK